ncbi:WD40 repeat-like protein [Stipitochalara longipes BDJ]|nr:WD40 repeat-like protein [Stipitochalara longipes BDJ]
MDRASQVLAQGVPPSAPRLYRTLTDHGNVPHSILHTLEGHSGSVNSIAFSHLHDSKLLASASYDKTVKVRDAATGALQQTLEGYSSTVRSITFSHDSKLLASASGDNTVMILRVYL